LISSALDRVRVLSFVCLALGVFLAGCAQTEDEAAVATPSFAASRQQVALGSPVELTYRFDVAPDAAIDRNYRVFVHFLDADRKPLWSDDHEPPIPTSEWKPGQTIGPYSRTVFVPVVPYLGEATVQLGLYDGEARLPLASPNATERSSPERAYTVGTLQILPSSENVLVINKSGWNQDEFSPDNPTVSWRWMQKVGTVSFRNPRKDVILFLDYDARSDLFETPQTVTVHAGDQVVTSFPADSTQQTLKQIPISAAQLGEGEMTDVRIEVDRTFVPANLPAGGNDQRELGIRVYHVFVGPQE
jgi:hypothetical protein